MKKNNEIHILGAGIGGLTAAITLAKSGRKAIIYERKKKLGGFFTETVHGMMNYGHYFREDVIHFLKNEIGLDIRKSFYPIYRLKRYSPSGKNFFVKNNGKPIIYNFLRGEAENSLEKELFNQAINLGVKIYFNILKKPSDIDIIATGPSYSDFLGYGIHYHYLKSF